MPACGQILPHGSYLVNLGSQDKEMLKKSYTAFVGELRRCEVCCTSTEAAIARVMSSMLHPCHVAADGNMAGGASSAAASAAAPGACHTGAQRLAGLSPCA